MVVANGASSASLILFASVLSADFHPPASPISTSHVQASFASLRLFSIFSSLFFAKQGYTPLNLNLQMKKMKKDSMNTTSPNPTLAAERCHYRTPTGRQCASRILDPESSHCPRHSASQPPDSRNFSALLTENASDFQDPQGINHSLAALYKLLASGRISTRRATGLAYIASLLLRTLPGIREQIIETTDFWQFVPARGRVGCSDDDPPNTPKTHMARRTHNARRRQPAGLPA
jgi:hypothetical protein